MIPEQFTITREHYERYKDFMMLYHEDELRELYDLGLENTLQDPKTGLHWDELLNTCFSDEYQLLSENLVYFEGCPHNIYVKAYGDRLNNYIELHPDADETYFIKAEYVAVNSMRAFHYGTKEQLMNQSITNDRRKEFLTERAKVNGFALDNPIFDTDNGEEVINQEKSYTVFGNYNYQLLYDIHETIKSLLPSNVTKHDFVNTFLLTEETVIKIDLIGANVSTFAYFIIKLHPYFTTNFRNKSLYNQWWSERFSFNGSSRDKKGISTMCSAVRRGEKTPDKKGTIDEILALLAQSNTYSPINSEAN